MRLNEKIAFMTISNLRLNPRPEDVALLHAP